MGAASSQPVPPTLTERTLPDQTGKVFLITGSTSGIGLELAKILYAANAKVWIVGRSASRAQEASESIRASASSSKGQLELLLADFNDLSTIKQAADDFLQRESRLDVLWNNAGIMIPPKGTMTVQKYEAQMGVNALAPFLFTQLLTGLLKETAKAGKAGETRVVWVSSSAAARFAPQGGVDMEALQNGIHDGSQWQKYGTSKAANILQASEFARRLGEHGILSVAADPGNLDTNLYKEMPKWQLFLAKRLALKPAIYGAYTELFAGLSEAISSRDNGAWVVPWGKMDVPRQDIDVARRAEADGGNGTAAKFWQWCETQVAPFA